MGQSGGPWERVAMDVLGPLPATPEGYKFILVVMDYFTKWVEIFPMRDQTAETVAAVLVDEVFSRMGCPIELHSDQGSNFKSKLMTEVYRLMGIKKTQTTPYHPRGDGMVERMNRTLEDMLAHCVSERQTDWDQHLQLLAMAYRSAPHSSTAEMPNLLMLGREVTLPVNLVVEPLPEEVEEPPNLSGYADDLLGRMRFVNEATRAKMTQQLQSQKRHFDQNVHLTVHRPGDVVWLKLHASKKGKSPKLMKRWGGPFLIKDKLSTVNYRIQETPRSKCKVVHGDDIKPCYGITPADLGFKESQRTPSQSAEAGQKPAPPRVEETEPGQTEPEQSATGTPGGDAEVAQNEEPEITDTPVEAEPLPQRPPRKRRQHHRPKKSDKQEPLEAPKEPKSPDPPRVTRTGRVIKRPNRYGWD